MGVFKRYKNAQAAQKDAENAIPGAYQSNYTDRINEALDSMGAASNAGYDVGTDSELYRQYRAGAQANARAAAENAAAGAAAAGCAAAAAGSAAFSGALSFSSAAAGAPREETSSPASPIKQTVSRQGTTSPSSNSIFRSVPENRDFSSNADLSVS